MPSDSRLPASLLASVAACALLIAAPAGAADSDAEMPDVVIKEKPTVAEKFKLPQTTESTTAAEIDDKINIVDTEDAVKYMPSLFVRKRNNGDTQPVLATRTWGVNSSARSLVFADDVPLTALIANNNTIGAPRWGMVAPEQIERIDVMYGPFAAAYPGNSMGAVMQITTRMPEAFQSGVKQTESFQSFSQYATKDTYRTDQTGATAGSKLGKLSWFLNVNHQLGESQPLSFVTNTSTPGGTSGTIDAWNKTGGSAKVVGAGGLLRTTMDQVNAKLAYDLTSEWKLAYSFGFWRNDAQSHVETYLTDANGNATYGGVSGFASGTYTLEQEHSSHALSLKSDTKGDWDWEAVLSYYQIDRDVQRSPWGASANGTSFTNYGSIARLDGTNWSTADAKGIWRPAGKGGAHEASFGVHGDLYVLDNPTVWTSSWGSGSQAGDQSYKVGEGKTRTGAVWLQDEWTFAPAWKATLGGRYEHWKAYDGYNLTRNVTTAATGAGTVVAGAQPTLTATNFSPKASLAWEATPSVKVVGSFGQAYRYPTVSELYQNATTTSNVTVQPNPNLSPERVRSGELAVETDIDDGKVRVSLFQENVANALIAQTNIVNTVNFSVTNNVGLVRNRGVELAARKNNVFFHGLEVSGSFTAVDSRILSDAEWTSTTNTTATGKRAPYVPDIRGTLAVTYRPVEELAMTVAGRYSGKQYSTLDNTDSVGHVFGAFDSFFVVDAHAHYALGDNLDADIGVDNINNEKYFLYHPFPQRTYVGSLRMKF